MLSIIIPVLNEAENIEKLLLHLVKNSNKRDSLEIIICDGGSTDGTQKIVEKVAATFSEISITLLHTGKGRAKQMNAGAAIAKGDIFYFLHADSFPPNNYDTLIYQEVEKGNLAGCFKMKFDSNHWWLRLASWLTKLTWRACRGGDQSQFITKDLFEKIGGYDESYIIYEDNILINELYKRKQFVVIQEWIGSSARLYREKGIWNLQYHFWAIYVKKWFGADADELYAYYCKHIKSSKKKADSVAKKTEKVYS